MTDRGTWDAVVAEAGAFDRLLADDALSLIHI